MKQALLTPCEPVFSNAAAAYPLRPGGEVVVGRRHDSGICIRHESVSRRHASLSFRNGAYVLSDLESSNGTFVNGVTICYQALRDGDVVKFGDVRFMFNEIECDEDFATPTRTPSAQAGGRREKGAPAAEGDDMSTVDVQPTTEDAVANQDAAMAEFAYAWRFLGFLADAGLGRYGDGLQCIVDDLAGLRGVQRVALQLSSPFSGEELALADEQGDGAWAKGYRDAGAGMVKQGLRWLPAEAGGDHVAVLLAPLVLCRRHHGFLVVAVSDDACRYDVARVVRAGCEAVALFAKLNQGSDGAVRDGRKGGATATMPVIVGRSDELRQALDMARKAARSQATVLIRGESGTGKELFARLIAAESPRRHGPYICLHCSAIEPTLMGSTLFGHEKGAFTGAVGRKKGIFEEVDGGTLFLDEIGELNSEMQVKLLRVLQDGEFMRVGGNQTLRCDVRVIAATNRNLEEAIKTQQFREDLYYRLNVVTITLPPLRARATDIPDLAKYFLAEFKASMYTPVEDISGEAMQALRRYPWPGNVRELRNAIERALVLGESGSIGLKDLSEEIARGASSTNSSEEDGDFSTASMTLQSVEQRHIQEVLNQCGGNKKKAADQLGISRSTLYEKLARKDE
ncbi:MAG: sigma 54-interacting transcriptional regulator [Lentisphaeria bacterium]|jgi:DNA-binding NtrC family response regulator